MDQPEGDQRKPHTSCTCLWTHKGGKRHTSFEMVRVVGNNQRYQLASGSQATLPQVGTNAKMCREGVGRRWLHVPSQRVGLTRRDTAECTSTYLSSPDEIHKECSEMLKMF